MRGGNGTRTPSNSLQPELTTAVGQPVVHNAVLSFRRSRERGALIQARKQLVDDVKTTKGRRTVAPILSSPGKICRVRSTQPGHPGGQKTHVRREIGLNEAKVANVLGRITSNYLQLPRENAVIRITVSKQSPEGLLYVALPEVSRGNFRNHNLIKHKCLQPRFALSDQSIVTDNVQSSGESRSTAREHGCTNFAGRIVWCIRQIPTRF
nr:hypothetical protein CFP56_20237 [Quercus suber]